jgi:hypothetical protein
MKADIIKDGNKIGEILFSDGSLSITCDDSSLRDRIYLHITSPEATEESQMRKLEAMQGTEHGTAECFKATLEFIDEMESDFDIKYS